MIPRSNDLRRLILALFLARQVVQLHGGAAHVLNVERPAEFNDVLLRFLDQ